VTRKTAGKALDVQAIRADFPILKTLVHGKPLVYLDNAATAQKPSAVIETLVAYYQQMNANVHRGIHALAEAATAAYEGAREKVAAFIGAPSTRGVVFTRGATEAINLVRYAWGRANVRAGDEIVITIMEHHSNLVPWQQLAQEMGATLRYAEIDDEGFLPLDKFERLLSERTKLVAVTHASNVLGTVTPARAIADMAHAVGAKFLLDGAQSVPHLPINVAELGCDFLAFSGHKMVGPTGIGILWADEHILDSMPPFQAGGEMIRKVTIEGTDWNDLPYKFEAGTPNIAGAIGLGAAVDYLQRVGMEAIREHEVALLGHALNAIRETGAVVYGPERAADRSGVVAFNYGDIHPHDIAQVLDAEGIAIRAGHHCCMPLMKRLGVAATARESIYLYNTTEEIDALCAALPKAAALFSR
jgi:cysteine desulfurase/selenocysteine lyase